MGDKVLRKREGKDFFLLTIERENVGGVSGGHHMDVYVLKKREGEGFFLSSVRESMQVELVAPWRT